MCVFKANSECQNEGSRIAFQVLTDDLTLRRMQNVQTVIERTF